MESLKRGTWVYNTMFIEISIELKNNYGIVNFQPAVNMVNIQLAEISR